MEKDKLIASAQRFVKRGQFRKAIAEVERIVASEPADMRARLELADLFERNNEPRRAVGVYLDAARLYEQDGFGLKGIGVYLQVTRLDPKHGDAHVALGRLYAEHRMYSEAAARFQTALDCATGPEGVRTRLDVFKAVLELDPDNLADRLRLGEAYSALGQTDEAVAEMRQVAEALDERAAEADFQVVAERLLYHKADEVGIARVLAASYVAQEEPQRALPKLKVVFEAEPGDLEVLGLLAETFNQLGQVHKSVAVLKEMARIYDDRGLIHERDDCNTKILMLDPNDASAREALGESSTEAVGQTLEFVPQPLRPRPVVAVPTRPVPESSGDDFDDFDFDFDDDEIGFGGMAENTIVDDAFIPEHVRGGLGDDPGISLAVPGTEVAAGPDVLQDELRELDFYINNGLVGEASTLLKDMLARHGQHPLLERREQEIAQKR